MTARTKQHEDTGPVKPANDEKARNTQAAIQNEGKELLEMCSQIGALIIGQRHDKMNDAIDVLNRQASGLLLRQHVDAWVPRYLECIEKLEAVVGKGLEIDQDNLVNDLRAKVEAAGYKSMKGFVAKVLMPVLAYNGLLLILNNDAKVSFPENFRRDFELYASRLKYVIGGACAAMALQDAMGM